MSATSCPQTEELYAYLLGTLPEEAAVGLKAHLANCGTCAAAVRAMEATVQHGPAAGAAGDQGSDGDSAPADHGTEGGATATWNPVASAETRPAFPQVEGYQVIGRLGEGGMGVVWKALQHGTHRIVALKLMGAARFGSEEAQLRFQREVDLTAQLEHPNIARVYDGGQSHGVYFYAMELVEGLPLDRYVKQSGLSPRGIVELMHTVCKAVQYAHQKGVIHRDLKPGNILVDRNGQPRVMDFGLAKALNSQDAKTLTRESAVMGTPAYMSPEQALGDAEHVDTRSDVYTLGVILFRLLTGQFPHNAGGTAMEVMLRIVQEDPRRLRQVDPRADRDLEAVLMKTLARDPEQRYMTAGGLAADLDRYLQGEPLVARPPTVGYLLRKRLRKHRKPILLTMLFLALVGLIAGYAAWDYYAQWGGWTEVARYDFTRPDATLDGLEFRDQMTSLPTPPWPLERGGLVARQSDWCVLKGVHVPGDVRLVLKLRYDSEPRGINLCINSAVSAAPQSAQPVGYSAEAGAWGNTISYISRNERPALPDTSDAIAATVPIGRSLTLTFQREGEELLLEVDGQAQVRRTEILPLTGEGLDGVGIRSWAGDAVIESMAVYRRAAARKASPVVAGDTLVEAGNLSAALRQYMNLADDYRGSAVGELALAKACRLSAVPNAADAAVRDRLCRRFTAEYPKSRFRGSILGANALAAWQEARYDEALDRLDALRAIDPQTRVALRMTASARADMRLLPKAVARRLMAEVGRVTGVIRMNIDGLGIDRLDEIGTLRLQNLACAFNPIESLEPLRGSPLRHLACADTHVASLEPLRGAPLRRLYCSHTHVASLEPLRGMPLEGIDATQCPVSDLGPLCQLTSLRSLTVSQTRIKSIEPLRGLPLRNVSINFTRVSDLGPLCNAPLEKLYCSGCDLTCLAPLHGLPLQRLECNQNRIDSLEPLRGMKLPELNCASNRITSLEPLRGMPLGTVEVWDNPLTTLEPLVGSPPENFLFDCPSLSDAELRRVRDVWQVRPEHRHHARNAEVLLAFRHHDLATLTRLAAEFRGHRYLFLPRRLTRTKASALCRQLGGHLATITSRDENDFLFAQMGNEYWFFPHIGLRRLGGKTAWETGEPVSFTNLGNSVGDQRLDGDFVFGLNGTWWVIRDSWNVAPCIIEWDSDPRAGGKQP